jgi:hypothetical protein
LKNLKILLDEITNKPIENRLDSLAQLFDSIKLRPLRLPPSLSTIGYVPIAEVERKYNLCMFVLPKGTVLPLHDHPGQHVFLRVVFGKLGISVCDIKDRPSPKPFKTGEIVGIVDPISAQASLTRSDPTHVVFPNSNNIHEICAVADSIFMDLVMPPYDWERQVTYFRRYGETELLSVCERDMRLDMMPIDIRELVVSP